ncbi:MAG: class I fructose-bisphosphate aldolase [Legionellaceae bacterium]|nr:class I fructose-bisphosphate aldolase [Legionellaceae bacterium]
MSNYTELSNTIEYLTQPGHGILAADESTNTIGKRFQSIGIENTEIHRRDYRLLLAETPNLEKSVHGVILFEETLEQSNKQGLSIPQIFADQGVLPGIKVDKGTIPLVNTDNELITQGLDALTERLTHYKKLGAKFAKWRNVYTISETTPSAQAMIANAEVLARYAAICQSLGIVPIVEPEVLMDGDHSIEACAAATEMVLHEVFKALYVHQVDLENILLKPNMITAGKNHPIDTSTDDIAFMSIGVFRQHVPAAVPGIFFLSGGQTPQEATLHLNTMNSFEPHPWILSFSYGRALQEECLSTWQGHAENKEAAQAALLHRCQLVSQACLGEYDPSQEQKSAKSTA